MEKIGIIGGSGLYDIEGFDAKDWVSIDTPFGKPSDDFLAGKFLGRDVVFLPRHARGHRILPSELNHRANIWAMKQLGVSWIISVSAVGSLQEKYAPGDFVLIDQFIDNTKQSSKHSFFGSGIVGHIPFGEPICHEMRGILHRAASDLGVKNHDRGINMKMCIKDDIIFFIFRYVKHFKFIISDTFLQKREQILTSLLRFNLL